jgi:hypothetical protein
VIGSLGVPLESPLALSVEDRLFVGFLSKNPELAAAYFRWIWGAA